MRVEIVGVKERGYGKRIGIRFPRMRKVRWCVVFPIESKKGYTKYILQAEKFIMELDPKSKRAIVNKSCEYFPCLSSVMGAKEIVVDNFDDLIREVEKVSFRDGDLIGVMLDGSPVIFKGGVEV